MSYKKKTALEKLHSDQGLPQVVKISGKMRRNWGAGTIVIPKPLEVDAIMRRVPRGKTITINEIRRKIAKKHQATIGCPITCGIFAWVAAHAAEEERIAGKKKITPWWRTLKGEAELNEKYPGGIANQKRLLEKEEHRVARKGKKWVVIG